MSKKYIAPSILSAKFESLGEEVQLVEKAGADWIHVDVMDGHFVPNITLGPLIVNAVNKVTSLPIDVHLMIEHPDKYIPEFIKAGATHISVHVEACPHLHRTLQMIKSTDNQAGVALNPSTSLATIEWVLDSIDYVLLMSVNPGFGGQSFIENSLEKIEQLREMIARTGRNILIQIDGGVNLNTIQRIDKAGCDIFVAGSAIFKSNDYYQTLNTFWKVIS